MIGGWGWGMGFSMGLFWVLLIVIVGAVTLAVVRGRNLGQGDEFRDKSALRILEERYARGEINRQEFEEKKRDLRN